MKVTCLESAIMLNNVALKRGGFGSNDSFVHPILHDNWKARDVSLDDAWEGTLKPPASDAGPPASRTPDAELDLENLALSLFTPPEIAFSLLQGSTEDDFESAHADLSIASDLWALGVTLLEIECAGEWVVPSCFETRPSSTAADRIAERARLEREMRCRTATVKCRRLRQVLTRLLSGWPDTRLQGPSLSALLSSDLFESSELAPAPSGLAAPAGEDRAAESCRLPVLSDHDVVPSRARKLLGLLNRVSPAAGAVAVAAANAFSLPRRNVAGREISPGGERLELESAPVELVQSAKPVSSTSSNKSARSFGPGSTFVSGISITSTLLIFIRAFYYFNGRSTTGLVSFSACSSCDKCMPLYLLDAQALSDSKKVNAITSPTWAAGSRFNQAITFEAFFSVKEVSQKAKINLTSDVSGVITHTAGVIFPFNGLVYSLDKLIQRPGSYNLAGSSNGGSEVWDFPSGSFPKLSSVDVVLASNDSFIGLHSIASPLRYGGLPLKYAAIANAHTVQLSLAGPAPAYEDRFRLNCTANGFFVDAYDDLPESTYSFPGEAPSVTRISASMKWIENTLTASCIATIRDGPEIPFFTATVAAVASPVYECTTRASLLEAFSSAFSSAIAFYGLYVGVVKYAFKYATWLRENYGRLAAIISSQGIVAVLPSGWRSGSKPVKLFGRISIDRSVLVFFTGLIFISSLFAAGVVYWAQNSGQSNDDALVSDCSCANGYCTSLNDSQCVSCIDGFKLSDELLCEPVSCACENGVCAPGELTNCSACAEAFQLNVTNGRCELAGCDCPNGSCGATTSHCTSCHDGYELRSTGRLAVGSARGGYFFTTPTCIKSTLLQVTSRAGGV